MLPARGGERRERGREGKRGLFVCLPALFYLELFADHSSDWPRNVTVLHRAGRVDAGFSDGSIRFSVGERRKERSEGHAGFDGMRWQR